MLVLGSFAVLPLALAASSAPPKPPKTERTIRGTPKADVIVGTPGNDRIYGFAGNDWIRGMAGDDIIVGGPGRDILSGGPGNDLIIARDGQRDRVYCGAGRDRAVVDAIDWVHKDCEVVVRPSPPPPDDVVCTTQNYWDASRNDMAWSWEQCKAGTVIQLRNTEWHCRQPLASYGALPIKVVSRWDSAGSAAIAVSLNSNCTGSPGTDVNLIVAVINEGGMRVSDVFKTRQSPGPQQIRMTGFLQGGARRNATDHQDCAQLQGGGKSGPNYLVNVICPDYDSGKAQVQGAGGTVFYSLNQPLMIVLGGEFIGCNASLKAHRGEVAPGSKIVNARFRSGNDTTQFCSQFHTSNPCMIYDSALSLSNVTCQRWRNGRWTNVPPVYG